MKTFESENNSILTNHISKSTPLTSQKFTTYPNYHHNIFTISENNCCSLNVINNNKICQQQQQQQHKLPHPLVKSPSSPANINEITSHHYHHHDQQQPPIYRKRSNSYTKETNVVFKKRDNDGFKVVNEYVFVRKLGIGTYGKVHLAYHNQTNQLFAIKVFNKIRLKKKSYGLGRGNAFQDVLTEIAVMKKLNHPNIVKLYEVINDPKDEESLYLVMEYIEGGSIMPHLNYNCKSSNIYNSSSSSIPPLQLLEKRVNPMSENLARKYFRDIVVGLEYLHEQKIIHRDIKPENLLVSKDGVVKITDFGVSHMFDMESGDLLNSSKGSPAFLAPELCGQELQGKSISGKAVDIWALGISLYCLIFAKIPFTIYSDNNNNNNNSTTLQTIYDRIQFQTILYSNEISEELLDLFNRLLDRNPSTRITIQEIKVQPWTTMNGILPIKAFINEDEEVLDVEENFINTFSFDNCTTSIDGNILPHHNTFQYSSSPQIKNDI